MERNRLVKLSAAAAVVIGLAGAAAAQGGPGGMMGWGPGGRGNDGSGWSMWGSGPGWGMGMMWGRGGRDSDWMVDRVEGRLAFLKTELKITEAQTGAWNQLADAIRAAAKRRNERMKSIFAGDRQRKTLPERVEVQEQFMTARLDEIKQIKASLKGLYDALTEEQRKDADDVVFPMVGMGGPWS
jgi:hypothetical protein